VDPWVAVHIALPDDAAEAIANFLFEQGVGAVVDDADFSPEPRPASPRVMEVHLPAADAAAIVDSLRDYAVALAQFDPTLGPIRIETAAVPPTDWEATYRAHHRPLAIGERLLVAPPWDVPAAAGREILVIEPGMAFGTGQHPTTRACLEELEHAIGTRHVRTVLDVGTGTAILAAAAARLGVPRVVGVDVDAATLPVARATCDRNRAAHVLLAAGSAAAVRGEYDLVLANLLADVLIADAPALRARTAAAGRLVVSGILAEQVEQVAAAFAPWRVDFVRADGPWRTLRLVGPG
jgi:ribosomal protein L11 methyltransferase